MKKTEIPQIFCDLYLVFKWTHLVLQAYFLTDVDEINPLGIEMWYRMTRRFSILDGIEAIRSVPKKNSIPSPSLQCHMILQKSF